MTSDTLDRLRAADPAQELDCGVPEDALHALLATPRPAPPRRTAPRARVVLPIAVAGAIATGAILIPEGSAPDLAAAAYAQTAPAPESVLYVRTRHSAAIDLPGRDPELERSLTQEWQRGAIRHRITRSGPGLRQRTEETLDAGGVLRLEFDGGSDTARRADGAEQREYIDRVSRGFVDNFRRDYERGRLDESGATMFAGRPARRYVVTGTPAPTVPGPPAQTEEYYLDAETGAPLGFKRVFVMYVPRLDADGKPRPDRSGPSGTGTFTVTVEALDHLPPTPENLAKLRA